VVERVERAKMAVFLCAVLTKLERSALTTISERTSYGVYILKVSCFHHLYFLWRQDLFYWHLIIHRN
jgi:hypothetical protein